MPQVFGADNIGLIAQASLWVEADYLDDVNAHEEALRNAGFTQEHIPVTLNRNGWHPRGDFWGVHLRSDPGQRGTHTWAIARVQNPDADPNAREFGIGGGSPRYAVEIHSVPKLNDQRARATVTPVWEGNDIRHFLTGQGVKPGQMTWPHIQRAMSSGPKR